MKYAVKRLLIAIPTLFGLTILVFFLASAAPGSPVEMLMSDSMATEEGLAKMEESLGLNDPVYIQYFRWVSQIVQGNMGTSYRTYQPVWGMVADRIGPTLILTGTALLIALLVAIPLGCLAAYKPYSIFDYISSGLSFFGSATPNFFAGLIAIYIFCVIMGWLPISGMYDSLTNRSFSSLIRHLILPASVLSLQLLGGFLRQIRSSMLESLGEDYINTARSKGLRERSVVFSHALRNSLGPLISQIGLSIPLLIGGTVVIEQIFGWPGIGSLMVLSINSRDYPTIMGLTVVIAITVLVGNILVDLAYGIIDPRVRVGGAKKEAVKR